MSTLSDYYAKRVQESKTPSQQNQIEPPKPEKPVDDKKQTVKERLKDTVTKDLDFETSLSVSNYVAEKIFYLLTYPATLMNTLILTISMNSQARSAGKVKGLIGLLLITVLLVLISISKKDMYILIGTLLGVVMMISILMRGTKK